MDLPPDVEDYIRETINHSLGIPITMDALQKKPFAAQRSQLRLYEQYMSSVSRLKEKDQVINLVRSEASINAQALKKFVEENQKLRGEYDDLMNQCKDLKRKCFIYQLDLDASKRSGNESEERARDAKRRVRELEQELKHMSCVNKKQECLVDSVLATMVSDDETKFGRMLMEANTQDRSCQDLLRQWDQLKPSMQRAVSLVSMQRAVSLKLDRREQELDEASKQNRELRKLLKQQCKSSAKRKEKEA